MAGQELASLQLDDQTMDCAFHPQRKLVAAGLVSGGARLLDCSGAEPSSAGSWDKHTDSCRSIGFGLQGNILFSASADRSIRGYDIESGKAVLRIKDAHDCAIERVLPVDDNAIASGDEDGLLKTWDLRTKSSTREFSEHTDFISDLVYYEAENCLLAVSGDGTLSINDLKSGKVRARSEEAEEMNCIAVLKSGKKIVCGTQTGVLNIYNWNQIADCSDRMPGHPTCVDAVKKLDEDTIVTASGDGIVRIVSIQPHSLLGVLAQQEEGGCERIALSHDHQLLATTSYNVLKLWDTSCLEQDGEEHDELPAEEEKADSSDNEEVGKKRQKKTKKQSKVKKGKSANFKAKCGFFEDLL